MIAQVWSINAAGLVADCTRNRHLIAIQTSRW